MRISLTILLLILLKLNCLSQNTFTSRKGSKFFPGHLDIVITVDNQYIRYELFNHWYSQSYAEYRQIIIPKDSLNDFNKNDSIRIDLAKNKVKLIDKRYHLKRQIRHKSLCASPETMRKISYAYVISRSNNLGAHVLYDWNDLKLDEDAFKRKVLDNLQERKK